MYPLLQTFVPVKYRNFCLWAKYILQAKYTGTGKIMYPSYKLIYRHNTLLLAQYTCICGIMTIFYNLFTGEIQFAGGTYFSRQIQCCRRSNTPYKTFYKCITSEIMYPYYQLFTCKYIFTGEIRFLRHNILAEAK